MHDHYFPPAPDGDYYACECGVDYADLDPSEEDYWRSLLAWVDEQH